MEHTKRTESAGGIVLNTKGKVVLVKNGPDFWGFPKGHVDPGEEMIDAARREILEESGLSTLTLIKPLPVYARYKGNSDGGEDLSEYKTIHMFLFSTTETRLVPQDAENPEARWVALDRVGEMLTLVKDKEYFRTIAVLVGEYAEHELDKGHDNKNKD